MPDRDGDHGRTVGHRSPRASPRTVGLHGPCAFALAVPTALTRAVAVLAPARVSSAHGRPATARHVLFDKTGTLSTQHLELHSVEPRPGYTRSELLALPSALERGRRIIRSARRSASRPRPGLHSMPAQVENVPGSGITGHVGDMRCAWAVPPLPGRRCRCAPAAAASDGGVVWPRAGTNWPCRFQNSQDHRLRPRLPHCRARACTREKLSRRRGKSRRRHGPAPGGHGRLVVAAHARRRNSHNSSNFAPPAPARRRHQ